MPISKKLYQYWFSIFIRHFINEKIWAIRKYENQTRDKVCSTLNSDNLLRDTDRHKTTWDTSSTHLLHNSACSKYFLLTNHYPNTYVSLPFKWTKCYMGRLLYTKTTQQNLTLRQWNVHNQNQWARQKLWHQSPVYLLTHSMVQSPSWEANRFSASQEIPHISYKPKVHYCIYKYLPPVRPEPAWSVP